MVRDLKKKSTWVIKNAPQRAFSVTKNKDDLEVNKKLSKIYTDSRNKEFDLKTRVGPGSVEEERPYPKSFFIKPKGEK